MGVIKTIIESKPPKLKKPIFKFELTREAALKNYLVLLKNNRDLGLALDTQQDTPLGYGSEFRKVPVLEPLLCNHPNWARLKGILTSGSTWELEDISEEERMSDLNEALARGNHKGAKQKPDKLMKLVQKDVDYAFGLVIPLEKITTIPGICLAPVNIAPQNTIDEHGTIISKDRLTHDQSFEFSSKTSVNSRTRPESLLPCPFGQAFHRHINQVVATRRKYPGRRIYSSKIDFKSAFRRMHLDAKTALRSTLQLERENLAVIMLRLTFGGRACPSEWGSASETICDLANAIINDPSWDPDSLFNEQSLELPRPESMPDEVEIKEGRESMIEAPVSDVGASEVFIDDIFSFAVDLPQTNNIKRLERACLLALHVFARPIQPDEPLPRHPMASRDKFLAEAGATESKIVLGWLVNYRELLVNLPDNKFTAWTNELQTIIERKKVAAKELEENIGRMIHVALILPEIYHFLNRLRCLFEKAKRRRHAVTVTNDCLADCRLLQLYIRRAHDGISMNSLIYQRPSVVYISDSCPHGLGGYNSEGRAWRWYIPCELLYRATNNLLEHIASIITVWTDIIENKLRPEDCILSLTDSSTSEGWHHKTNFKTDPAEEDCDLNPIEAQVRTDISRHFAELCVTNKIVHYAQWFPGEENNVSDALSRDDDRSNEELTNLLYLHFPEQMPGRFEIAPLPVEIVSWLTSLLQKLPVKEQLQERRSRTKIGRSEDGKSTPDQLASRKTSGWTTSTEQTKSRSSVPSQSRFEKDVFLDRLMAPWRKRLSEIPSYLLHRPLGITTGQTQQKMKMENLEGFYHGYSEALRAKILRKNSRKPCQQ